jgi:hypothetical protein
MWLLHIFAFSGLMLFDFDWFLTALVLYILINPLHQIISHNYISHEYIEPRLGIFKILFLMIFYHKGEKLSTKRNYHTFHHKMYKTNPEQDPTMQLVANKSLFRYLFSLHKPVALSIPNVDKSDLSEYWLVKFCDQHSMKIYWAFIIVPFLLLPLKWFVILRVYVPWMIHIMAKFHDYYFHGSIQGNDNIILFMMYGGGGLHVQHHDKWLNDLYGTKFTRWFNLGWYYRLLFFKPNATYKVRD